MGSNVLEPSRDESKKIDSYRIIQFKSPQLPEELKPIIIAPFMNSLRYGNDLFKLIDQDDFYNAYKKYIAHLLQRENNTLRIAMLIDDTVVGWSMVENNILHYVWVKKEGRRQGIGSALIPQSFDTITHITNKGINIWVSKFPHVKFNPFA